MGDETGKDRGGAQTRQGGSLSATGASTAAGPTAHVGSRPWKVERTSRPRHYAIRHGGVVVGMVDTGLTPDDFADRLNAEPGCGCRAVVEAERCAWGKYADSAFSAGEAAPNAALKAMEEIRGDVADVLDDVLRTIASRLPAPSAQPGGVADALADAETERDMAEAHVDELTTELARLREENRGLRNAGRQAADEAAHLSEHMTNLMHLVGEPEPSDHEALEKRVTSLRAALAAAEGERDRAITGEALNERARDRWLRQAEQAESDRDAARAELARVTAERGRLATKIDEAIRALGGVQFVEIRDWKGGAA